MSNFTDFISGGGGASFPTIFLSKSQTWVPPQDGNIMIHVIGAGGSGAANTSATYIQSGGAGAYCRKNSLAVTTSSSFTVVIGAGGASAFLASAGNNGGTTSVAGTGLGSTLTATGGAGGALNSGTYGVASTATGGDVNYSGGRGGATRGGGAVGLTGNGNDGISNQSSSFVWAGANCDVVGDLWSSSLGQIAGGVGGQPNMFSSSTDAVAAPLAGAGGTFDMTGAAVPSATIGGGGGQAYKTNTGYLISGRGGEGIVVIQYIP